MQRFTVEVKHPDGSSRIAEFPASSAKTAPTLARGVDRVWAEQVVLETIAPVLYRVVDENPYLDRSEEWDALTLEEAATRVEDLYPVEAAQIISDVEEGVDWPMRYVDEETGREITLSKAVS